MSLLCPLDDDQLPLEASGLKSRQVEVALAQLKAEGLGHEERLVSLEALARLAWSDDAVRELVAAGGGVRGVVDAMAAHSSSDSIQCHGCLALMSLVRGEGEVCQSNQWLIAKAGAIEAMHAAMERFASSAMVQLSVLLALIPLALENAMMQAHVTQASTCISARAPATVCVLCACSPFLDAPLSFCIRALSIPPSLLSPQLY